MTAECRAVAVVFNEEGLFDCEKLVRNGKGVLRTFILHEHSVLSPRTCIAPSVVDSRLTDDKCGTTYVMYLRQVSRSYGRRRGVFMQLVGGDRQ